MMEIALDKKGCICHFIKWQIHPLISKGAIYSDWFRSPFITGDIQQEDLMCYNLVEGSTSLAAIALGVWRP